MYHRSKVNSPHIPHKVVVNYDTNPSSNFFVCFFNYNVVEKSHIGVK